MRIKRYDYRNCISTLCLLEESLDNFLMPDMQPVKDTPAAEYARSSPDDPDLPEITERVKTSRDIYLRWGRDCLGWAIYLFRKPD